jgi:hypothetical protein
MVYYITVAGKDLDYVHSLTAAKNAAVSAYRRGLDGQIQIEAFTGKSHGSGGYLKYKLNLTRLHKDGQLMWRREKD